MIFSPPLLQHQNFWHFFTSTCKCCAPVLQPSEAWLELYGRNDGIWGESDGRDTGYGCLRCMLNSRKANKNQNTEEVMEPEPELVQTGVLHPGSEELVPVDVTWEPGPEERPGFWPLFQPRKRLQPVWKGAGSPTSGRRKHQGGCSPYPLCWAQWSISL